MLKGLEITKRAKRLTTSNDNINPSSLEAVHHDSSPTDLQHYKVFFFFFFFKCLFGTPGRVRPVRGVPRSLSGVHCPVRHGRAWGLRDECSGLAAMPGAP